MDNNVCAFWLARKYYAQYNLPLFRTAQQFSRDMQQLYSRYAQFSRDMQISLLSSLEIDCFTVNEQGSSA